MKEVLLNWLPPAMENMPSPGLSALKGFLSQHGYNVKIKYWNLIFKRVNKEFFNISGGEDDDFLDFAPFFSYLAIHNNDMDLGEQIKYMILLKKPSLSNRPQGYIEKVFLKNYESINSLIDEEIDKLDIGKYLYVGFTTKFNQWIIANIIIERILKVHPETIIIAGGCGTANEAQSLMKNFPHYQYVSWGEGEHSLLKLTEFISQSNPYEISIESIPNIVYRRDSDIKISTKPNVYINLDEASYDYSDYFEQLKQHRIHTDIYLPVERARGCSWKKCRFCFLNNGYKFRVKSIGPLINEIKESAKKYGVFNFFFMDNDVIADNLEDFEEILNQLIDYRSENNRFTISLGEIVTKGLTSKIIRKITLAGFKAIQIGYESTSANLLKKIDKKNSFASNLMCVKWGRHYGLSFKGVNVMRNMLDETASDVKEAIRNLHLLRFLITKDFFEHRTSHLAINSTSKYFEMLKPEERDKYYSILMGFLPQNYVNNDDKYYLFFDFASQNFNILWEVFEAVDKHYLTNKYSYTLIHDRSSIYYTESYNSYPTKELEFEEDSIHWRILKECNDQVMPFDKVFSAIVRTTEVSSEQVLEAIDELVEEGIFYCDEEKRELVSIINTNLATSSL